MKRLTLALLAFIVSAGIALPQEARPKSIFGVNAGVSIPVDEFSYNTFRYDAGFASPGPNIEAEYLRYGKFFGLSASIGYASIFFNENDYREEYDLALDGYGTNDVTAGNYQVLRFLVGFTLKIPEFHHTEVMLLFNLGYAVCVHPDLTVTNSELGVINSVARDAGGSPVSNACLKINYWLNEHCGLTLTAGVSHMRPGFHDSTGPGGSFFLPIHYTSINAGFVMNLNRPVL